MAVRLKYAGIKPDNIVIEPDLKKAVKLALKNTFPDEKLYIMPTYTALLKMQKFIKKL